MIVYYKIRHKETQLYVKGTPHYHGYDETGRIFQKIGHLRAFLTGVMNNKWKSESVNNWEIVELEMVIKDTKEIIDVIDKKKIIEILAR
jgi:hypothetical protein